MARHWFGVPASLGTCRFESCPLRPEPERSSVRGCPEPNLFWFWAPRTIYMFYVYILKCGDGSYYTGYTHDLLARLKYHYLAEGCIYTYMRQPVKLVFFLEFSKKYDALNTEKQIKRWGRRKKEALINGDFELLQALSSGQPNSGNQYRIVMRMYPSRLTITR